MPTTEIADIHRRIIAVLLKGARIRAGRSVEECAGVIGVKPDMICAYEEARCDMSLPELEVLAYFLRVPIKSFLEGDDESLVMPDSPPGPQVMDLRHRIIGALLHQAREEKGRSRKDLAALIHCTPRRITRYEQGQVPIPLSHLEALAEQLSVPLSYFLDEGIGSMGEREQRDRQGDIFQSLPDDVRAFVADPASVPYLRVAMHLAQMPAGTIRQLAEGLLDITY